MTRITIDIETIPTQNKNEINDIKANVQPPKNIKKAESIEKWHEEKGEAAANEAIHKTGLNGGLGQVTHIGYKFYEEEEQCIYVNDTSLEAEKILLIKFDQLVFNEVEKTYKQPFFIGHNISGFDLKFLYHRYVVHDIAPRFCIPWDDAPWKDTYFDTMTKWAGIRDSIKLETLCKYLDIKSPKDGIDGSQVWAYIQEGRYTDVANYCKRDVAAIYKIFERQTFEE